MKVAAQRRFQSRDRFIFGVPPTFFEPFDQFDALEPPIKTIVLAFRYNLHSAAQVGSIPFQLTHQAVLNQRFNQIFTAERIRALPIEGLVEDGKDEASVRKRADDLMASEVKNPEVVERFADETLAILDSHLRNGEFSESSNELLRQIVVMTWGAFEILFNDLVRYMLNTMVDLSSRLFEEKQYKDLILSKSALPEALRQHGFDLSKVMGDLFCDAANLDSLPQMRRTAELIFSDPQLNVALKDEQLWTLAQRRHLIVHRRGIVDANYLAKTSGITELGGRLTFTASEVEASMFFVRGVGLALIKAAIETLRMAPATWGD